MLYNDYHTEIYSVIYLTYLNELLIEFICLKVDLYYLNEKSQKAERSGDLQLHELQLYKLFVSRQLQINEVLL